MELFPTKLSAFVFVAYMALFTNQGILVTATKETNSTYKYSTLTVVMLIECIKLFICSAIYVKEFSFLRLFQEIFRNTKVMLLYFVPAFLYTLYNNLTFINLSVFDPTTYYLLLQIRVVMTGILFQFLFQKQLSRKQWASIVLLTLGCAVKQVNWNVMSSPINKNSHMNFYFFLILVQVFCSCFAGVYNEYLLKGKGADVHIMLQNIFMYLDCIACNMFAMICSGEARDAFSLNSLRSVFTPLVIAVMLNGAGCGIITSLFLKNLNSILKTFAAALEIIFTAILCWIIFGIPIDIFTLASIVIVSYAIFLYAQNPVNNNKQLQSPETEKMSKPETEKMSKPESVI